jgi:hypothetical protein
MVEAIIGLRRQLAAGGHDAGAATIAYHLAKRMDGVPSRATIWRILKRQGLITPQPQKRPRSSLIRFEADLSTAANRAPATRDRLEELQALPPTDLRNDKVDAYDKLSIRYRSKLHHIGLGRAHKGRQIKLLIADQSIRVIDQHGQLIRELTLDPSRDYQPLTHT